MVVSYIRFYLSGLLSFDRGSEQLNFCIGEKKKMPLLLRRVAFCRSIVRACRHRVVDMENGDEHESANGFKLVAALCLFTIAATGGMLPMRLKDLGSRVISSLNTAAGGVFFASAMVSKE